MNNLYQKIYIENFETIRNELLQLVTENEINFPESSSWTVSPFKVFLKCPSLLSFLKLRCRQQVTSIKFYLSPPGKGTSHHIDGGEIRHPFGLTLPLLNTKGTFFNWYKEDKTNFIKRVLNDSPLPDHFICNKNEVYVPDNIDNLELLNSLEILEPTFIRSDLMHNVSNFTDKPRLVVILRWVNDSANSQTIDDVINVTDILI
jgi:hypothetical protein